MDLLQDLKMLLSNFNFVMIYIIHKMLVLLKNHLNYSKDSIFECSFKEYNRLSFFLEKLVFFTTYIDVQFKSSRSKHNLRYKKSF